MTALTLLFIAGPARAEGATSGVESTRLRPVLLDQARTLWDPDGHAAAFASTDSRGDVMPSGVEARLAIATEGRAGLDVVGSLRYRAFTWEGAGRAVDVRVAIARTFGRLQLAANALVGQSFGGRDDVDLETAARLAVDVTRAVSVGLEGRARTELVDDTHTIDDDGRSVELLGGPTLALDVGLARVEGLAGWCSPRGSRTPGPATLLSATVAF